MTVRELIDQLMQVEDQESDVFLLALIDTSICGSVDEDKEEGRVYLS